VHGEATDDFQVALDLVPPHDRLALELAIIRVLEDPRHDAPGRDTAPWGDEFEGCIVDASIDGYEIVYEMIGPNVVRFLDLFPEEDTPFSILRRRRRWQFWR
jgi:hypothetical protein